MSLYGEKKVMNENGEIGDVQNLSLRLMELLNVSKSEKNAEWLAEVNQHVAKLSSFYSQKTANIEVIISEEESIACLTSIASITYAANVGIKDAKKRVLNVKYWDKNPYPSIIKNLPSKLIQIAAYKKLSVISNQFSKDYLESEIALTQDIDVNAQQFEWLLKIVKNPSTLIETVAKIANSVDSVNLYHNCVSYLNERIKKQTVSIDTGLCKALATYALIDIKNDKLNTVYVDLIDSIFTARPDFLLNIDFLIYVGAVKKVNLSNKKFNKLSNDICIKFFDLAETISVINPNFLNNDYIKELAAEHSNYIADIAALKKNKPEKYTFTHVSLAENETTNSKIELNLIELAASWDDYKKNDASLEQRRYIEKKIENLLSSAKIDQYSQSGEVILFDPTKQENINLATDLASKVKVIKPGYTQTRLNGSIRVLRKAIVETVND